MLLHKYIFKHFIKCFAIVVLSGSFIISVVIASQELIGMPNLTTYNKITILTASLLSISSLLYPFYIAMALSLLVIELGSTTQFTVILSSGLSATRALTVPILVVFLFSLIALFALQPLETKLLELSQEIIKPIKNEAKDCIIKDIPEKNLETIIKGKIVHITKDAIDLKNAVILLKMHKQTTEIIKANNAKIINKSLILKDVTRIQDNYAKKVSKIKELSINTELTNKNALKQIDSFLQSDIGLQKNYTLYQLIHFVFHPNETTNEPRSIIKFKFWSLIKMPLQLICAILTVILVTSKRAVTRNGLRMGAIFLPQLVIGFYTYISYLITKNASGAMKYEFSFVFLPYALLFFILLFILKYRKIS